MKNYCCFVNFATRDGAENAMANLFNKLMIKGQKYKLMWGRLQNDSKKEEDEEEQIRLEKKSIQYQTECPLYDPNNYNPKGIQENTLEKTVYPISMNIFDPSSKSYYPSMDPNAQGGLLKKKRIEKHLDIINNNTLKNYAIIDGHKEEVKEINK